MKFGETNAATRIMHGLVGIAGIVLAATLVKPDPDNAGLVPVRTHRDADSYSR